MKKVIFGLACLLSAQFIAAMDNNVDISGLDKKSLLKALYYRAEAQGLSFLSWKPGDALSDDDAEKILEKIKDPVYNGYIEGIRGRVMEINLSDNFVNTKLYNYNNGVNAAEAVIEKLRSEVKK